MARGLPREFIGHYTGLGQRILVELNPNILVRDAIRMSNGLPRESIGQTQPQKNPSLLVRDAIRMTFYGKNLGGIMVNVVPRQVPRIKPTGPAAPRVFGLGTSLGTTFTMIPPRV